MTLLEKIIWQWTALAHRPLLSFQEHFFVVFLLSSTKGRTFWWRLDAVDRAADDVADAVDRYWPIISATASAVSSPRCRSISSWWTASSRSVVPCADRGTHTSHSTSYHHRLPTVCSQHAVRNKLQWKLTNVKA